MRIAAIADIHGNLPALKSVLKDCENQKIDQYIFLGDYITDGPFSNEVLDVIRSMDAIVVKGNRENRTLKLGPTEKAKKVMAAAYWARDSLRKDSLEYIGTLEDEAEVEIDNVRFHISHHPTYHRKHENGIFDIADVPKILEQTSVDFELYGHTHRPLKHTYNDKHVFNPGSCGLALNGDPQAHYGIITINDGNIVIEHRRCNFDLDFYLESLQVSGMLNDCPLWTKCTMRSITTGNNYYVDFLTFAKSLMLEHERSLDNWIDDDIWELAGSLYDFDKEVPPVIMEDCTIL